MAGEKKSKWALWADLISKAKGQEKIIAIFFGWIFVFTAHEDKEEENNEDDE